MSDHLPEIYSSFRERFPGVAAATDNVGAAASQAGPLDERTQRLVKLGLTIGAGAEGAVRSNARRALDLGIPVEELNHVAVLAISTAGFPAAIAGLSWIDDVVGARTA